MEWWQIVLIILAALCFASWLMQYRGVPLMMVLYAYIAFLIIRRLPKELRDEIMRPD